MGEWDFLWGYFKKKKFLLNSLKKETIIWAHQEDSRNYLTPDTKTRS